MICVGVASMDDLRFFTGSERSAKELRAWMSPSRPVSHEEQVYKFNNALFPLYFQAERVRHRALSWRNFCVGCAVWSFRADASTYEDRWAWHYGMNTKVEEGSRNICAEPIPINAAYAAGRTEIIGMVVVGLPREQDTTKTLRPCEHCRLLMKKHPLITPRTIIVSALPPQKPLEEIETMADIEHEVHTFEGLLKEYGESG